MAASPGLQLAQVAPLQQQLLSPAQAAGRPKSAHLADAARVGIDDLEAATLDDVVEVAAASHTQFGISMTAGDAYVVAGSATGSSGHSGDGSPATCLEVRLPGPRHLNRTVSAMSG